MAGRTWTPGVQQVIVGAALVAFSGSLARAQEVPPVEDAEAAPVGTFQFGSYGRVIAATDLEGGIGKPVNVVSHGPRLEERPYLELDLSYTVTATSGAQLRTLTTLAVTDALFHLDGDFDGSLALRNAYVEASELGVDGLSLWAGSRMYRGDDIYLLDFWPMDELNTIGGGVRYRLPTDLSVALHVGVNQLRDTYQYQEITVAGPGFATEQMILNDRVRMLGSLRLEQLLLELTPTLSAKAVLWFEGQSMGEGTVRDENEVMLTLPADGGWAAGLQLGMWGFTEGGFANVFLRYARGLAAYGELTEPTGLALDRSAGEASLVRLGTSANLEVGPLGLMGGAYVQRFTDADSDNHDPDDYTEAVFALRPILFVGQHYRQGFEASYQTRMPDGLSRRTDTYLEPAMWKLAVVPALALQPGSYSRPEIRMIYSVSLLNAGAQDLFPPGDPRHERSTQHFFGIGAEWWFNSSSYE